MGLGDLFTRLFFGKKDSHFFASDAQQKKNVMNAANGIVPLMNGTIKERDGGDEVHITGEFAGASTRVKFQKSFAGVTVEMKTEGAYPFFMLTYDEDGRAAYGKELENRDEWDNDDDGELKVFVSDHLYYDGDSQEIAEKKTLWEKIPQDLRDGIVSKLEERKGHFIVAPDGKFEMNIWDGVLGMGSEVEVVQSLLDLLSRAIQSIT